MQRLILTLLIFNISLCLAQQTTANVHYSNGLGRYKTKDFKAAVADFTLAIESDPANADAYYQRGFSYFGLGNSKLALEDFNKTLAIDSLFE